MSAPALRDIERTMRTLWMDRKSRERFLDRAQKADASLIAASGSKKKSVAAIDDADPALLDQIDSKGVKLYAGLLNFGHHEVVDSIYPCCARLIGDRWDDVVDQYLEHYSPTHYNLNRTASMMSQFFSKHGERWLKRRPYLAELADYEWLELELLEQDTPIHLLPHEPLSTPEHFEQYAPVVNPVLAIRNYDYPITSIVEHLQSGCCLPKQLEPTGSCVAVYRDPQSNNCRFLEIGAVTAKLIEQAKESPKPYKELLACALASSSGVEPQQAILEFLELVEKLQSVHLFVGSLRIK